VAATVDAGARVSEPADALRDDLVSALTNLGYHRQAIDRGLDKVIGGADAPPATFETALRAVLKELSRA
jgi:Holliday junction resolvasome RuvABC DNA-binding subunit